MATHRKDRNRIRIDPNKVKTRDHLMVRVINGATKAGVQKDRRKETDRRSCRDWRHSDEEE